MTKEEKEKKQEDIDREIKSSDHSDKDSAKSHGEILKEQLCQGQEVYNRSNRSILLSSIAAGLEIGFSFLLICSVYGFFNGKVEEETIFKISAFVYPVGFIMVILGQSILFTEQTSLLTLPVLNKKRSVSSLLKLWGIVIAGNLVGGYIMAFVVKWVGMRMDLFDATAIEAIGHHVTDHSSAVILVSSILAGWLMALLSWLVSSSKETISRLFVILLITTVIGFTGLHHSIVGNIEAFAGMLVSPEIQFVDYLRFQSTALIGNALGAVIFVAILKYRAFVYNVDSY